MPLSLLSLLTRRYHVTELAPYEWSRSTFSAEKWGLCSPLLKEVENDISCVSKRASPLVRPTGGETEKKGEKVVSCQTVIARILAECLNEGQGMLAASVSNAIASIYLR